MDLGTGTTKSNRLRAKTNSRSSANGYIYVSRQKAPDLAENVPVSEQLVQDVMNEYTENGYFGSDLEYGMPFG